jgi:uncharacterized protein (TIGR02246 family)
MREHPAPSQNEVRELYWELLACWNRRDARGMAALFAEGGNVVGFDGSPLNGQAEIAGVLSSIFAQHPTPPYVAKVREVRLLADGVALLRAVVGMVPVGQEEINPALNAIQTLVVARREGRWQVELFHNTPAAFHGRPEAASELTEELRALLRKNANAH